MRKHAKAVIAFLLTAMMAVHVEAYEFAAIKQESDENTVVIEAEDFVRGSGFEIVDGSRDDGGRSILGGGDASQAVEYDITFDTDIKQLKFFICRSFALSEILDISA